MSNYNYICESCGEVNLDLPFGTAKDKEICPNCGKEIKRSYSPTNSIWKCSGDYNSTR